MNLSIDFRFIRHVKTSSLDTSLISYIDFDSIDMADVDRCACATTVEIILLFK